MPFNENEIRHPSYSESNGTHPFVCGHCNHTTSGRVVSYYPSIGTYRFVICTNCGAGSLVRSDGITYPSSRPGSDLEGLPQIVEKAYNEARDCYSIGAFTACELICRKILMNISVDKGAKENDYFVNYLDFLKKSGYVTDAMMDWVSLIRENGGESTHQLKDPDKTRAESTLIFTEQLLKIIYEMKHKANKYTPKKT